MDNPSIDGHCANCATKFRSASQIFNQITVIDEVTSFQQEIATLDAVLYIYGFSASNLARAYLEHATQGNIGFDRISETSDYISQHGLSLCPSCVSAFKEVYVANYGLKALSKESSILSKAIKMFSPNFIKVEDEQAGEYKYTNTEAETEDSVRQAGRAASAAHFRKTLPEPSPSYAEETENVFPEFNFENDCDNYENEYDIKHDPLSGADFEMVLDKVEAVDNEPEEEGLEKLARKIRPGPDKELISNITTKTKRKGVSKESHKIKPKCVRPNDPPSKRADPITSHTTESLKPYTASGVYLTRRAATHFNVEVPKLGPDPNQQPVVKVDKIVTEEEQHARRLKSILAHKMRKKGRKKRRKGWQLIRLQILKEAEDLKRQRELSCTCGKTFGSLDSVRDHVTEQELGAAVICDMCGENFQRKCLLFAHKSKQHQSELKLFYLKCSICDEKCHSANDLEKHKEWAHPISEPRDEKCHTASDLEKHKETAHPISEPRDEKCHTASDLEKHKETAHPINKPREVINLMCSCGQILSSLSALRAHERNHEHQEPIKCNMCDETFTKLYKLYGHRSMEHLVLPQLTSKCQLCNAKFLWPQRLQIHMSQHHSTSDKTFTCDKCGRSFSCVYYLKKHEELHKDDGLDKEFKCGECGIFLKHSRSLKNHMTTVHGTPKIFICPQCGKTTKSMTNMRIHMKVHDPNRTVKRKASTFIPETFAPKPRRKQKLLERKVLL